MSIQSVKNTFKERVSQLGKAALSALYPNDFPYFFIAFELVDSQNNSVDYFAFPILPDEIRETHQEITTVRKTIAGVYTVKNPSFTPRQISIRGTFGRSFKILLGGQQVEFAGFNLSIKNGKFNVSPPNFLENPVPQFSTFAKTGYGCIKVLEAIKEKSKKLDDYQKPFSLYLYNPILGGNYQVEFNSFTHMQDSDRSNMIPTYNVQLTAVASLDSILSGKANFKSALKNLAIGELQKDANRLANRVKSKLKR